MMGDVASKQNDNSIKLMKIESKELGKYGDPIGQKISGVQTDTIQLMTRLHINSFVLMNDMFLRQVLAYMGASRFGKQYFVFW